MNESLPLAHQDKIEANSKRYSYNFKTFLHTNERWKQLLDFGTIPKESYTQYIGNIITKRNNTAMKTHTQSLINKAEKWPKPNDLHLSSCKKIVQTVMAG